MKRRRLNTIKEDCRFDVLDVDGSGEDISSRVAVQGESPAVRGLWRLAVEAGGFGRGGLKQ